MWSVLGKKVEAWDVETAEKTAPPPLFYYRLGVFTTKSCLKTYKEKTNMSSGDVDVPIFGENLNEIGKEEGIFRRHRTRNQKLIRGVSDTVLPDTCLFAYPISVVDSMRVIVFIRKVSKSISAPLPLLEMTKNPTRPVSWISSGLKDKETCSRFFLPKLETGDPISRPGQYIHAPAGLANCAVPPENHSLRKSNMYDFEGLCTRQLKTKSHRLCPKRIQ